MLELSIPIIISITALLISMHSRTSDKLRIQEEKTLDQKIENLRDAIKRLHERLDGIHTDQSILNKELNGKDGVYSRLASLEAGQ